MTAMRERSKLPADVLRHILSFIPHTDRRTLLSFLLASRAFYHLASARLYHTVRISSHSHLSPFYDAVPPATVSRGALAKRRGAVGNKAVRSRKARLMDDAVKVLEVDGRMDGPFGGVKAAHLPAVRTMVFDMSHTTIPTKHVEGASSEYRERQYELLSSVKPRTIVIKHLSFHQSIDLPDILPATTISNVERLVYMLEVTSWDHQFGRTHGPSGAIQSFGLHQWLDNLSDPPPNLRQVDIIFWSNAPGLTFTVLGNKYVYLRGAGTWLERYIEHIAETLPTGGKFRFNFVNTGAFDHHAVRLLAGGYDAVQAAFAARLLRELGPNKKGEPKLEEVVRFSSVQEWFDDMQRDVVDKWDLLSAAEVRPWIAH